MRVEGDQCAASTHRLWHVFHARRCRCGAMSCARCWSTSHASGLRRFVRERCRASLCPPATPLDRACWKPRHAVGGRARAHREKYCNSRYLSHVQPLSHDAISRLDRCGPPANLADIVVPAILRPASASARRMRTARARHAGFATAAQRLRRTAVKLATETTRRANVERLTTCSVKRQRRAVRERRRRLCATTLSSPRISTARGRARAAMNQRRSEGCAGGKISPSDQHERYFCHAALRQRAKCGSDPSRTTRDPVAQHTRDNDPRRRRVDDPIRAL